MIVCMDEVERREQLKTFLRARREALRPETFGLETGARRRTPGLRREEVAALARVGVTWYTWLEQGREIQPSRDALSRIARALRLTPTDESYFFVLAGEGPAPALPTQAFAVDPHLKSMMNTCGCACVLWGPFLDVLAYNHAAGVIFGFDNDDCEGPFAMNQGWRAFMVPSARALYEDFEDVAARVVVSFRAHAASRGASPALQRLVDDLRSNSKEFARLWKDSTLSASPYARFQLRLRHPRLGRMKLARVPLTLATEPDLTLLTLVGADKRTAEVLSRLTDQARRNRTPKKARGSRR
jgi:transcriptional regulator with XRE-family HTH domain